MNEQGNIRWIFSWPMIIVMCILFWPLGLVLAVKRISIDFQAMYYAALLLKIAGILWCLFTILTYVIVKDAGGVTTVEILLIMSISYIPIGIFIFWAARHLKKRAERREIYVEMLTTGGVRKLETLSKTTGESVKKVKKEVLSFIKNNIIKDAYIDERTQEVVFEKHIDKEEPTIETSMNVKSDEVTKMTKETSFEKAMEKDVVCQNCGATNTIRGEKGECEYCGSVLK